MTYAPLNYKLPRTDPYDRYYLVYSRRKVRKLYLPGFREVLEPRLKKAKLLESVQHRKLSSFLVERAKQRDDNADRASVVYFYRKKPKWITTADARDHFGGIAK